MARTIEIVNDFLDQFLCSNWQDFFNEYFDELNEVMPKFLGYLIDMKQETWKGLPRKFDDDSLLILFYHLAAELIENQGILVADEIFQQRYYSKKDISKVFIRSLKEFIDAME